MAKSLCSCYLRKELEADLLAEIEQYLCDDPDWRSFSGNGGLRTDPDAFPEEVLACFRSFLAHKLRRRVG